MLRSAFKASCACIDGMLDSGNASHAYSANQSAPFGGLNRIYLGNVTAV